jgi:hypothetical protein
MQTILLFVWTTIWKVQETRNCCFFIEQMTWLKNNFDKSEVLLIGGDSELAMAYAGIFNCNINVFHLKYLGVPISAGRLHVSDWIRNDPIW